MTVRQAIRRWGTAGMAFSAACVGVFVAAAEPAGKGADPQALVAKATEAAGGKDKLLTLFRYTERLNVSADPAKPGNERTSTVQPPTHWWLGKRDRVQDDKEPAIFLVWGWTLGALHDPKSKLTALPEIVEEGKPAVGLRVAETIEPPLDLYFDKTDFRLVRIDWRSDIHRFSEIREHDGVRYPAKVVGTKKSTGKPWYFSEILKLERLKVPPVDPPR